MKTIFEKIIDREIESYIVFEDEKFIAFLDALPKSNGHTLVVPKNVKENFLEEDYDTLADLINLTADLSVQIKHNMNADGVKLVSNVGEAAGQEVFHTHFHIIPYYNEDQDEMEKEEVLSKIKSKGPEQIYEENKKDQ